MLAPVLISPPAVTPVTLAQAKSNMRVDHSDDDTLITSLIEAATGYLDGWSGMLGRALITQTWRIEASRWTDPMRLPLDPVQSIDSVVYWDANNADQVFSSSSYSAHIDARGMFLKLNSGVSFPSVYDRENAVMIEFVAGYGDAPADVPAPIRQAILLLVAHWYDRREAASEAQLRDIPFGVTALLSPYRKALL